MPDAREGPFHGPPELLEPWRHLEGIAPLEMDPVVTNRRKGIGREPAFNLVRYIVEVSLELGDKVIWALRQVELGVRMVAFGSPAGRIVHQIGKRDMASARRQIEVPGA